MSPESDYNWYGDNLRVEDCSPPCPLDLDAVAAEPHGQLGSTNPFVAWDGVADPASAAFGLNAPTAAGMSLPAEFSTDMFGTVRGADGVWDRGAVELGPAGGHNPPAAPRNLRVK